MKTDKSTGAQISKTQYTISAQDKLETKIAKQLFNNKEVKWRPETLSGLSILSTAWSMPDITFSAFWDLLTNKDKIRENINSSFEKLIQDETKNIGTAIQEIDFKVKMASQENLGVLTKLELSDLKAQLDNAKDFSEVSTLKTKIEDLLSGKAEQSIKNPKTKEFLRERLNLLEQDLTFGKTSLNPDQKKLLNKIKNLKSLYDHQGQKFIKRDTLRLNVYVQEIDQEINKNLRK